MTPSPFFTIAIPTKNRTDRLCNAVRSVREQTFTDVEVIVCDNSDEPYAPAVEKIVADTEDPRVRYIRTSGKLSMPDNWERAIADATRAIELSPDSGSDFNNRGRAYLEKGEFSLAIRDLTRAVELSRKLPIRIATVASPISRPARSIWLAPI